LGLGIDVMDPISWISNLIIGAAGSSAQNREAVLADANSVADSPDSEPTTFAGVMKESNSAVLPMFSRFAKCESIYLHKKRAMRIIWSTCLRRMESFSSNIAIAQR
jgi:hypothetical protein